MDTIDSYFLESDKNVILTAIREAESYTSVEIKIHVEMVCEIDVLDRASEVFSELDMHKTKLRNGVLIYLAVKDNTFAIIGDKGISEKIENLHWGEIKDHLTARFKAKEFVLGLTDGVRMIARQLMDYFPSDENEQNEISDEISFGYNQ